VRAIGCLFMVSGWLIVMAALTMLHLVSQRYGFVVAGLIVEFLGVGMLANRYKTAQLARSDD